VISIPSYIANTVPKYLMIRCEKIKEYFVGRCLYKEKGERRKKVKLKICKFVREV